MNLSKLTLHNSSYSTTTLDYSLDGNMENWVTGRLYFKQPTNTGTFTSGP